jgi:hypothetical protein
MAQFQYPVCRCDSGSDSLDISLLLATTCRPIAWHPILAIGPRAAEGEDVIRNRQHE